MNTSCRVLLESRAAAYTSLHSELVQNRQALLLPVQADPWAPAVWLCGRHRQPLTPGELHALPTCPAALLCCRQGVSEWLQVWHKGPVSGLMVDAYWASAGWVTSGLLTHAGPALAAFQSLHMLRQLPRPWGDKLANRRGAWWKAPPAQHAGHSPDFQGSHFAAARSARWRCAWLPGSWCAWAPAQQIRRLVTAANRGSASVHHIQLLSSTAARTSVWQWNTWQQGASWAALVCSWMPSISPGHAGVGGSGQGLQAKPASQTAAGRPSPPGAARR